ncbi:alpha/beta hydrolase [Pseudomonas sp. 5P_3.1_Bac2]|uniref:alpha/beta hydrolase n=1 Tax=Pseudomonas sp. 5P_3.1_Bac2 TaxID=2971617 RepID=UPI0021C9E1FC|nr:lysophospholipase [Pseudomonas sp. 5P_3.1_Bac2]MCU1716208.1 lysophospholipase [Pseudomonas sp. 5P_3.1_Bac2]
MLRALIVTLALSSSFAAAATPVKAPAVAISSSSQQLPMRLQTADGTLFGTLLKPNTPGPQTVALLIAGSGPTDRDGNNPEGGHNDSLKRLALSLAKQGIASLRYDKRGIAASRAVTPDERDLTVEHYVDDAVAWAQQLKADPAFNRLVLVGHSEGALIASLAASRAKADALVSIAGSYRPIDQLLRDQLAARLPPPLVQQSNRLLDQLKAGHTSDDVPQELQVLFRPSVQPYLISLLRQDPGQAFAQLKIPALIVQGTHDIQVSLADAHALQEAKPDAEVLIVPGMNHVLRIVPLDYHAQLASYNNPKLPLAGGLADYIGLFILQSGNMPSSS